MRVKVGPYKLDFDFPKELEKLYTKNELDELFEEIKVKEEESHLRAVPELEVRTVDAEGERREKVKYTTVDDILEGNDDLFEEVIKMKYNIPNENYDEAFEKLNAKINSYYTALIDENQGE